MKVQWVGHATALVEVGGHRILTDPLLTRRVAHLRRRRPLPTPASHDVDTVLLSHAHLDHLHLPSLRRINPTPASSPRSAPDVCSPLAGFHRRHRGARRRPDRHRRTARDRRGCPGGAQARPRPAQSGVGSARRLRRQRRGPTRLLPRRHRPVRRHGRPRPTSTSPCCRSGGGARRSEPGISIPTRAATATGLDPARHRRTDPLGHLRSGRWPSPTARRWFDSPPDAVRDGARRRRPLQPPPSAGAWRVGDRTVMPRAIGDSRPIARRTRDAGRFVHHRAAVDAAADADLDDVDDHHLDDVDRPPTSTTTTTTAPPETTSTTTPERTRRRTGPTAHRGRRRRRMAVPRRLAAGPLAGVHRPQRQPDPSRHRGGHLVRRQQPVRRDPRHPRREHRGLLRWPDRPGDRCRRSHHPSHRDSATTPSPSCSNRGRSSHDPSPSPRLRPTPTGQLGEAAFEDEPVDAGPGPSSSSSSPTSTATVTTRRSPRSSSSSRPRVPERPAISPRCS